MANKSSSSYLPISALVTSLPSQCLSRRWVQPCELMGGGVAYINHRYSGRSEMDREGAGGVCVVWWQEQIATEDREGEGGRGSLGFRPQSRFPKNSYPIAKRWLLAVWCGPGQSRCCFFGHVRRNIKMRRFNRNPVLIKPPLSGCCQKPHKIHTREIQHKGDSGPPLRCSLCPLRSQLFVSFPA